VCPGILETLGIPLVAGREFTAADRLGAPGVALVNESFAKEFWPGEDAVGKRFKIGAPDSDAPWLTVVGISKDVRHYGLESELRPWFWRPYQQSGWPFITIVAKTASSPLAFERAIRKALAAVEPEQPVSTVRTMDVVIGASVSGRRFPMMLLSGFALLALALSAVGIAGVVGYSVVQRTQEIGVRMALGAQPNDVLQLVIGHSMGWTLGGMAAGFAVWFALLRFLDKLVYGVKATDPLVLGTVTLLLLVVALAASYLPARRAMRVNPVDALRGV
jgi:putative ABC transport system permease protein